MNLPINYNKSHWSKRRKAREEYVKLQEGKCWFCKNPLSGQPSEDVLEKQVNKELFPRNFFKWPVHLHHSHETGMTIGAVHCHCNAVLWQFHGE